MHIYTDFLIIGSGVAGLKFALKVAEKGSVAVVTKKEAMDSNTNLAQGGIASVFGEKDSFELHIKDTLAAGDGLCHEDVVDYVVSKGPSKIKALMDVGVRFNMEKKESERFDLGREGGHSQNRIIHAKDMTGNAVECILVDRVKEHQNITLYENHIAVDLITQSIRMKRGGVTTTYDDICLGAYVLNRKEQVVHTFSSAVTLLATGGAGKVYLYTSNPDIATGDGIAMAYRAGATVANMEFVQFHPTCLYHPDAKNFLISEAVRGEGGILKNAEGVAFMEKYDPLKDLACRDVVARAIDQELKKSGQDSVFLDISHRSSEFITDRFPNLYKQCKKFGIDMTSQWIPVVPAAHYTCGGVVTDLFGKTDIERLYAVGEAACTGLHGANRLASNSLLEALVYADAASEKAILELQNADDMPMLEENISWDDKGTTDSDEAIIVSHNWDEIRRLMWNYVGIVRSNKRLDRAKRRIENIQKEIYEYYWDFKITPDLIELRNIAMVAELIIKSAMNRKESRGLHYNIAYPKKDDSHRRMDTIIKRGVIKITSVNQ